MNPTPIDYPGLVHATVYPHALASLRWRNVQSALRITGTMSNGAAFGALLSHNAPLTWCMVVTAFCLLTIQQYVDRLIDALDAKADHGLAEIHRLQQREGGP